jgi:hypothetical protein
VLRRAEARTTEVIMTDTQAAYAQLAASDAHGSFRDAGYNL